MNQKLIEAMCYSRWSEGENQAGFSWQTTASKTADDKTKELIENIQSLWDKIEYDEPIYLQGVWNAETEIVYFGIINKDKDQSGRPCHIKEIWIVEKSLWEEIGGNPTLFWNNCQWFTNFQASQQGKLFLENAKDIKKNTKINCPKWLPNFISEMIVKNTDTLIIAENNSRNIFYTLSLMPASLMTNNQFISIGWHQSLLNITTNFDVVFCHSNNIEKTSKDLAPYNSKIITTKKITNPKVDKIINGMFSRKKEEKLSIPVKQEIQTKHSAKRISMATIILIGMLVILSFYIVNLNNKYLTQDEKLLESKKELNSKQEKITRLKKESNSKQEMITKLEEESNSKQEMITKLKKELNSRDNDISNLNEELNSKDDEMSDVKEELEKKLKSRKEKNRKLQKEIAKLKAQKKKFLKSKKESNSKNKK